MVLRLVARLVRIALGAVLVLLVVQQVGPALAVHSMQGYVAEYDAARSGHPADAATISDQLAREWRSLGATLGQARSSIEHVAHELLPSN